MHDRLRQRDVTTAVRGVEAAGHAVARVEIGRDGTIVVIIARVSEHHPEPEQNEWDAEDENGVTLRSRVP